MFYTTLCPFILDLKVIIDALSLVNGALFDRF